MQGLIGAGRGKAEQSAELDGKMNSRGRNFLFGRAESRLYPTSQGAGMRKLLLQVWRLSLNAASANPKARLIHACGHPVIKIVSDSS